MNTPPVLNADLHCHSVVSDGTLSPEALAERAHLNGVQLWSLTDHDELGGQLRAQAAAAILGIDYVAGVEISITWLDHTVHIVGLGIDPTHPGLIEGLRQTRDGRRNRAQAMAEARLAWRARPREISAANLRAEHRFLNRVINLMSRTRKNEAYAEACNLWNECCGDHLFAYPEDRAL